MDITSYLLGKNASGGGDLNWSAIGYTERPVAIDYGYNYAKTIQQNWTSAIDLTSKFAQNYSLIYMPLVDTSEAIDMTSMFSGCTSLQAIALLDTSNVTTMYNMFLNCYSLATIPLLNTSNVTSMGSAFSNCYNLKEIPQIDTSKVTNISSMFNNCYNLTTVPQLDTSSAKGSNVFTNVFKNCNSLSTTSLNNILGMCAGATKYTSTKTLKHMGISSEQATICQGLSNYQAFLDAGWTTGY